MRIYSMIKANGIVNSESFRYKGNYLLENLMSIIEDGDRK